MAESLDHALFAAARAAMLKLRLRERSRVLGRAAPSLAGERAEEQARRETAAAVETPHLALHLLYQDAGGAVSSRNVTVMAAAIEEDDVVLECWCHEADAQRTFRASRILEATDLATGEISDDALGFLKAHPFLTGSTPEAIILKALRPELALLRFLSAADGQIAREEEDVALRFVLASTPERLDEAEVRWRLRMLVPSAWEYEQAVARISARPGLPARLIAAMNDIVAADGRIDAGETAMLKAITERLAGEGPGTVTTPRGAADAPLFIQATGAPPRPASRSRSGGCLGAAIVAGGAIAVLGIVILLFPGAPPTPAAPEAPDAAQTAAPPDNTSLMASDPAAVCVSAQTMEGLRGALLSHLWRSSTPTPEVREAFAGGLTVSVESATLSAFDPATKKVACVGEVTIGFPADLQAKIRQWDTRSNWRGLQLVSNYSVEPAADGQGLVYTLEGRLGPETADFASGMAMALANLTAEHASAPAATAAAPAEPEPAPPPPPAQPAPSAPSNATDEPPF